MNDFNNAFTIECSKNKDKKQKFEIAKLQRIDIQLCPEYGLSFNSYQVFHLEVQKLKVAVTHANLILSPSTTFCQPSWPNLLITIDFGLLSTCRYQQWSITWWSLSNTTYCPALVHFPIAQQADIFFNELDAEEAVASVALQKTT